MVAEEIKNDDIYKAHSAVGGFTRCALRTHPSISSIAAAADKLSSYM